LYPKDSITLGEGRGNTFIMLLKELRNGDCGNAINSKRSGNSGGSYAGRPSESECLWKKMIGKPYSLCEGRTYVAYDLYHTVILSDVYCGQHISKFD
jgi:hypothetical protein